AGWTSSALLFEIFSARHREIVRCAAHVGVSKSVRLDTRATLDRNAAPENDRAVQRRRSVRYALHRHLGHSARCVLHLHLAQRERALPPPVVPDYDLELRLRFRTLRMPSPPRLEEGYLSRLPPFWFLVAEATSTPSPCSGGIIGCLST